MISTEKVPYRKQTIGDDEPLPARVYETTSQGSQKKEYNVEERMNSNLMRQFKGMFEEQAQTEAVSDYQSIQPREHREPRDQKEPRESYKREDISPQIYNLINQADSEDDEVRVRKKNASVRTAANTSMNQLRPEPGRVSSQTRQAALSKTSQNFASGKLPPPGRAKLNPSASTAVRTINPRSSVQQTTISSDIVFFSASTRAKNGGPLKMNVVSCRHGQLGNCTQCTIKPKAEIHQTARNCDACSQKSGASDRIEKLSISSKGSNFKNQAQFLNKKKSNADQDKQSVHSSMIQGRPGHNTHRKLVSRSLPREQVTETQSNFSVHNTTVADTRRVDSNAQNLGKFTRLRPMLPKAQEFKIAKVEIAQIARPNARNNQTMFNFPKVSERMSGSVEVQKQSRPISAKTAQSTASRLEKQRNLQKSNAGELMDERIKIIHQEWQNCDPNDEEFWQKIKQVDTVKKRVLRGQQVTNQQLDVLSKQEEVFRDLKMEEEMNSEMMSQLGYPREKRLWSSSGARPLQNNIKMNDKPPSGVRRNTKTQGTNERKPLESVYTVDQDNHVVDMHASMLSKRSDVPYDRTQKTQIAQLPAHIRQDQQHPPPQPCIFSTLTQEPRALDSVRKADQTSKTQQHWNTQARKADKLTEQAAIASELEDPEDSGDDGKFDRSYGVRKSDHSEEDSQPSKQRKTAKYNIASYDDWLEQQSKEQSKQPDQGDQAPQHKPTRAQTSKETARARNSQGMRNDQGSLGFENGTELAEKRPKTSGLQEADVEVVLESMIEVRDGHEVRMVSLLAGPKNPETDLMASQAQMTQIGEFLTQESGVHQSIKDFNTISQDDLNYSQSLPTQSRPTLKSTSIPNTQVITKSKAFTSPGAAIVAQEIIVSPSQLNSREQLQPVQEAHQRTENVFNYVVAGPTVGAGQRGRGKPPKAHAKNVRDFLDYEDSDDENTFEHEPPTFGPIVHTMTLKAEALKTNVRVLHSEEEIDERSPHQRSVSEMIAQIDYNVSNEAMSASYYAHQPDMKPDLTFCSQFPHHEKHEKEELTKIERQHQWRKDQDQPKAEPRASLFLRPQMSSDATSGNGASSQAETVPPKHKRPPIRVKQKVIADQISERVEPLTDLESQHPIKPSRPCESMPEVQEVRQIPPMGLQLQLIKLMAQQVEEMQCAEPLSLKAPQQPATPTPLQPDSAIAHPSLDDVQSRATYRPKSSYSQKPFRRPMTAYSNKTLGTPATFKVIKPNQTQTSFNQAGFNQPSNAQAITIQASLTQAIQAHPQPTTSDSEETKALQPKNEKQTQTDPAYFSEVDSQLIYQERLESTDWAYSAIYNDILLQKSKRLIRPTMESQGTQVDEEAIDLTHEQVLKEIECDYNAETLKKKLGAKDFIDDGSLLQMYSMGLTTLRVLMCEMRLQREWDYYCQTQYVLDVDDSASLDPAETVKLLTRCRKMYEARAMVQLILKMVVQRNHLLTEIEAMQVEGTDCNSKIELLKRTSERITLHVNALQEEHRVFKRPFVINGVDFLEAMEDSGNR